MNHNISAHNIETNFFQYPQIVEIINLLLDTIMQSSAIKYPPKWPATPFHSGELKLQKRYGVREMVDSYAPKVVRPFMPEQHREFYSSQPFLVVAARDEQGQMWSTLLTDPTGDAGFITSPSPTTLSIRAQPMPGDALEHALLQTNIDMGILGIEFATKRRNRVNGRTGPSTSATTIEFRVDQSFGNCPQYIRPRRWWSAVEVKSGHEEGAPVRSSFKSSSLSRLQIKLVQNADTIFIATGYRGDGEDSRYGNDASHRGGRKGFVRVQGANTLLLPDYSGNNHYNTLGNLEMDERMGITIPSFGTGGMLQMSGRAKVVFDEKKAQLATNDSGAKRMIEFSIEHVIERPPGSLPIRWAENDTPRSARPLRVAQKVKESDDVTSFYLRPTQGDDPNLWPYSPGQHLPISFATRGGDEVSRTYSLSSGNWGEYRISVKREPKGLASQYLHDDVHTGDILTVNEPAGDFVLGETNDRTLVLISAGVGVTPILSMLHSFVSSTPSHQRTAKAIWVHGARDGKHHPFQGEVNELSALSGDSLDTHVVYSRPHDMDIGYDSVGHVDASLIEKLVPDLRSADFYMCGPSAFMADIQNDLEEHGVDANRIQYEQF